MAFYASYNETKKYRRFVPFLAGKYFTEYDRKWELIPPKIRLLGMKQMSAKKELRAESLVLKC